MVAILFFNINVPFVLSASAHIIGFQENTVACYKRVRYKLVPCQINSIIPTVLFCFNLDGW